jgi:citronellyl-CoA synthetase
MAYKDYSNKVVTIPELISKLPAVTKDLPKILQALKYNYTVKPNTEISVGEVFNKTLKKYPNNKVLLYNNHSWTYKEFDLWVNRLANNFLNQGFHKGDVVAVLLENRPEILAVSMALAKIGCVAALLNNAQRNQPLKHSIHLAKPRLMLVGEELVEHYLEIQDEAEVNRDKVFLVAHKDILVDRTGAIPYFDIESNDYSTQSPKLSYPIRAKDACMYIYTSGTTGGLPKAAIISHGRWIKGYSAFGLTGIRLNEKDIMYVPLPFYHATAMVVCWTSVIAGGAALAMRNKFSVSEFWVDIDKYKATAFGYIGELCKYLLNAPVHPLEKNNTLVKMIGNGMRPAIWNEFKSRFGIEQIAEFYASSEGNIAFFNIFNIDGTMGFTVTSYAIVKYDKENENPVLDRKGHMIKVKTGETGLLLGEINDRYPYDGYTEKSKTESTIFRNVFGKGDAWFNTGDLVRDMGFKHAQFVDRLGDTFRWKGENVATTEVEGIINQFEGVSESIVYGVEIPNQSGRAGMANIILKDGVETLDFKGLYEFLDRELPPYAVPMFIRLSSNTETTTTFKYKKHDLKVEGYDITKISSPVYFLLGKSYTELSSEMVVGINEGKYKL